ncbi:two-component system sensor histidine kinase NtrB [Candidatus Formimonas warabiya]|uniref:histidine kinase n=1 Tax=Formimonas warabiya TaxID=1761012 RepID=A0A3G1KX01_FORW1|nr:ATP-binding protein [Candidatus Formimonas warabiya]ATW27004.1 hypothetical protein DCMF_21555 [Candidatus Formimonas warabiya]
MMLNDHSKIHEIFADILSSITDALLVLDQQSNIIYSNQMAKELFLKENQKYGEGEKFSPFILPEPHLSQGLSQGTVLPGSIPFECYFSHVQKYMEVRAFPFPKGITLLLHDITERKIYDQEKDHAAERKQFEIEMERLDRLNSLGEMVACIGHELRNPMTTVRGFLQLLGEQAECLKFKDSFDLMIEELDKCNSIITEFLSLAKNRVLNLESGSLNEIVMAIAPLIREESARADKNVMFELEETPDLLLDQNEIRQLILNLMRNALEAMGPGKMLVVKTYREGLDVVLAVKDQGPGMDLSIIEKIGIPFVTTKENCIGLGLAVCFSIAARHNAVITFDTCSKGTTFFVRFRKRTA